VLCLAIAGMKKSNQNTGYGSMNAGTRMETKRQNPQQRIGEGFIIFKKLLCLKPLENQETRTGTANRLFSVKKGDYKYRSEIINNGQSRKKYFNFQKGILLSTKESTAKAKAISVAMGIPHPAAASEPLLKNR